MGTKTGTMDNKEGGIGHKTGGMEIRDGGETETGDSMEIGRGDVAQTDDGGDKIIGDNEGDRTIVEDVRRDNRMDNGRW